MTPTTVSWLNASHVKLAATITCGPPSPSPPPFRSDYWSRGRPVLGPKRNGSPNSCHLEVGACDVVVGQRGDGAVLVLEHAHRPLDHRVGGRVEGVGPDGAV